MTAKDDNQLVSEVISGEVSSFEELIDRYQKKIYYMVLRMVGESETAKDLTQDIFVRVYEKLGTFKPEHRFFSWIYRITMNEAITWSKRHSRFESLDRVDEPIADDHSSTLKERGSELLNQGLQSLEPDYRMLLVLKYYGGMSYDEVAAVSEISVEKVRSRLFIAREQLRKILIQKGFLEDE